MLGLVLVGFTVVFVVVATGALEVEPGTGDVSFPAGVAEVADELALSVFPLPVVPAAVLSVVALAPVSFFVVLPTFVAVEATGLAVVVEVPVLVSAGDVCSLVALAVSLVVAFPPVVVDGVLERVFVLLSCCSATGVGVVVVVADLGVAVVDAVAVGCTAVLDPGSNQRELKACTYTHTTVL